MSESDMGSYPFMFSATQMRAAKANKRVGVIVGQMDGVSSLA